MKKEIIYTYFGENGSITSPVKLLGQPMFAKKYLLTAEEGKLLTSDYKEFFKTKMVTEEDSPNWVEE